jgi:hypothetical protein
MTKTEKKGTSRAAGSGGRRRLLRDIGVLQVKLIVDGFRDLVLVPLSLIAGAVSLLRGGREPGPEFYDLLRMGKESERWINLFGAVEDAPVKPEETESAKEQADLDQVMERIETFVVDEYRHGHITSQAKEKLDRAIERLQKAVKKPL